MDIPKLERLKLEILTRAKALMALLGTLANLAYAYNATHPDPRIQSLLVLLALIGVHQTPDL